MYDEVKAKFTAQHSICTQDSFLKCVFPPLS